MSKSKAPPPAFIVEEMISGCWKFVLITMDRAEADAARDRIGANARVRPWRGKGA